MLYVWRLTDFVMITGGSTCLNSTPFSESRTYPVHPPAEMILVLAKMSYLEGIIVDIGAQYCWL